MQNENIVTFYNIAKDQNSRLEENLDCFKEDWLQQMMLAISIWCSKNGLKTKLVVSETRSIFFNYYLLDALLQNSFDHKHTKLKKKKTSDRLKTTPNMH